MIDTKSFTWNKSLTELTEIEIYFIIKNCGEMRWRLYHDAADGRPWAKDPDKQIEMLYNIQKDVVKELTRFGVNALQSDEKTPSENYWYWWYKWDIYVKSLSEKKYNELVDKINKNEDVSKYKP